MDIEAKIRKLESDIRMKQHYLFIEVSPVESDVLFKSSLREQIKHMEKEVELLKQMLEASKDDR
jgi:hypothetical protein